MSLGLGKKYWVHMIKHFYGTLEECINYMNQNKPRNNKQWYELRPDVNVKEGTTDNYSLDLVEISK